MNKDIVFLAAGLGSRLFPITNDTPKAMVKVHEIPILENQIKIAKSLNFNNIYVVSGYREDKINFDGVKKLINNEYQTTNMLHSLYLALNFLVENSNDLIISYSDIIYHSSILEKLINNNDNISIITDDDWLKYWSLRFQNPLEDAETCIIDNENCIKEIGKKTSQISFVNSQYIGLLKFNSIAKKKIYRILNKEFINRKKQSSIRNDRYYNQLYLTDLLQHLIESNFLIRAVRIKGNWLEIDSIKDLKIAEKKSKIANGFIEILR